MRITNNANIQQPAGLNTAVVSQIGAGEQADLLTGTGSASGSWGALLVLSNTVIATLVSTSIKTLNGAAQGIAASAAVLGVTYTIQTLGNTTQAQFTTLFGPAPGGAGVWAVGMSAQAVGAGTGTAVLTTDEQVFTAITITAGAPVIYGQFKSITLTSGALLAYRA